jgi:spore coat polysaccharide biosynthesis protein SpsF
MPNVTAIVQARMGSTRLPGKVLRRLAGQPLLAHLVRRLGGCRRLDRVIIATTVDPADDAIEALTRSLGLGCFRGSEEDVLSRYAGAAAEAGADVIVRITSDCPLIDPEVVDSVVARLARGDCDYASNTIRRTYPRGLDTEALTRATLDRLQVIAEPGPAREHVTWLVHRRTDEFRIASVEDEIDSSDLRWTVDTDDDWRLVDRLYRELDLGARVLPYHEMLAHVRAHPELALINAHVEQKTS